MTIPKWFDRELRIIDPEYYVYYNETYRYWEIKKKIEVGRHIEVDGRLRGLRLNNPTVAVFDRLNDDALNRLRKRKLEGLKYRQNTKAYLDDIVTMNRESREKKRELAVQIMAEGVKKIVNWGKSQQYDMGSAWEKHNDPGPA